MARDAAKRANGNLLPTVSVRQPESRALQSGWFGEMAMDKDRVKGMAKQAKGAAKQAAGSVMGDAKLKAEGKAQKTAGKVQNAVGGMKDAMRKK